MKPRALRFERAPRRSRSDLERELTASDPLQVCGALVSAALHDSDWRWVLSECVRLSRHPHPEVRGLAASCIGHIARIHHAIDLTVAEETLARLERDDDRSVAGRVQDARDDIVQFATRRGSE